MARPKKKSSEVKSVTLAFRVTASEFEQISDVASKSSASPSELARRATLETHVPLPPRKGSTLHDPALISQLKRLGNNLNQIAMRANQSGRVPRSVDALCEQISDVIVEAAEQAWD